VNEMKGSGIRDDPPLSSTCELLLEPFDSSLPRAALLHDQSDHGCSILCVMDDAPKQDDAVLLKMGALEPLRARVTYALHAATDVQLIGCEFLGSAQT
jgi:hypothetical protein